MKTPDPTFWKGKRVFITGHTGFKGGWLSLWLKMLGAELYGYSVDVPTEPSFFDVCRLGSLFTCDSRGDLANLTQLRLALHDAQPEVLFHLAAQPLVRESYVKPLETFMTNTMGTAHVLDACRDCTTLQCGVLITTDKVYANREWHHPYRENDRLGGYDPYSASKAAAEIVVDSYRQSFFHDTDSARIATVRAGNVIGGGDWAADRLVPDCLRSFAKAEPVVLRNPNAIRPWQHVLEPLSGYLLLAEKMFGSAGEQLVDSLNFGPDVDGHVTVQSMAEALAGFWGEGAEVVCGANDGQPHEAGLLKLDISLARSFLNWRPKWGVAEALEQTVAWQKSWLSDKNMRNVSLSQIEGYVGR